MKFPQMDEYHLAIQNPQVVFSDPELRVTTVEKDPLFGLPKVSSGGFALTYRLNANGKAWAVRCFHKDIPNRQQRYGAISQFIANNSAPFFIPAEYLPIGILVNGSRYPITKMSWVSGETLYKFIERNLNKNLSAIKDLLQQFRDLILSLERLGVAHGDLQHGNILVANGKLVLVDYDGMYVPTLKGLYAEERGHVNYQHPQRNAEFDENIDRFSAIVIYLALKAITPAIWQRYSTGGENLLFSQDDFRTPDKSKLLAELEQSSELRPLIQRFRLVCKNTLAKVPRLTDFLSGDIPTSISEPVRLATRRSQYKVLDATNRNDLLAHIGQRVTIVGKITDHWRGQTKSYYYPSKPYVFLSFGAWERGSFRLVLWSETLQFFADQKKSTDSYSQQWVSVTGLLSRFETGMRVHPQIIIETPSEIEVLAGETEAKERLDSIFESSPIFTPHQNQVTQSATSVVSDEVKRKRLIELEHKDGFGITPKEVEEYRNLKREFYGTPPALVNQVAPPPVPKPPEPIKPLSPIPVANDPVSDLYKNWVSPTAPTRPSVSKSSQAAPKPPENPKPVTPPKSIVVQPQPTQPQSLTKSNNVEICPHCNAMVRSDHIQQHIKKRCPVLKQKGIIKS